MIYELPYLMKLDAAYQETLRLAGGKMCDASMKQLAYVKERIAELQREAA